MTEKIQLKTTDDNSSTLYSPAFKEHYHSTHGAISESQHVFIHSGLAQLTKDELNILEVGFGTGLNALLSLKFSKEIKQKLYYSGIKQTEKILNQ